MKAGLKVESRDSAHISEREQSIDRSIATFSVQDVRVFVLVLSLSRLPLDNCHETGCTIPVKVGQPLRSFHICSRLTVKASFVINGIYVRQYTHAEFPDEFN
ncbi:hypothetical protein D918_00862 [Trichuris suis]|nr:hypothetical protein D918_00862 [Trichuris suis]